MKDIRVRPWHWIPGFVPLREPLPWNRAERGRPEPTAPMESIGAA